MHRDGANSSTILSTVYNMRIVQVYLHHPARSRQCACSS